MNNQIETQHSDLPHRERVYNASLLFAFLANVFQLIAVSLLFRYADFIELLGGDEWHLGWIVGMASIGAIACRLIQGVAIDRLGPGFIWLISIAGEIVAILWHLKIDSASSIEVYLARSLFAMSLAGTFGAWLSFISLQAPYQRIAEVIGVVGSSGFVGMAIGPTIGDWLFSSQDIRSIQVANMFYVAAAMAMVSMFLAFLACLLAKRDRSIFQHHKNKVENPLWIIWKNNPGFILVVGMLMGLTIGFPGTYLSPFAESLNIENIKSFFIIYNLTAFVSRLIFRRAPQVLGLSTTILLGFGFMAISMLLYLPLENEAGFWLPATAGGLAHSFIFPSVIAACTNAFPVDHRGLATQLILGMYDLGVLIGMPIVGFMVTTSRTQGLEPYPFTIKTMFGIIVAVCLVYLFTEQLKNRRLRSKRKTS